MNRGFTVVEVLITLVVMTVLLTLGVFAVRGTLANARDTERKDDIAAIARGLELYYERGIDDETPGSYPGYNDIWNKSLWGSNLRPITIFAPGTTDSHWKTPTNGGVELLCIFNSPGAPWWETAPGCEAPGNLTRIRNQISPDKYGYEAVEANGIFCYNRGWCTKYNLYWIEESTGELKVHRSKRQ